MIISKTKITNFSSSFLIIVIVFSIIPFAKENNINSLKILTQRENYKEQKRDKDEKSIRFKIVDNLEKSIKRYEKDILELMAINQENKLQIEINKIYLRILYIIIFTLLFVFIIIIIIKLYFQCKKSKKNITNIINERKTRESISDKNNIINNSI